MAFSAHKFSVYFFGFDHTPSAQTGQLPCGEHEEASYILCLSGGWTTLGQLPCGEHEGASCILQLSGGWATLGQLPCRQNGGSILHPASSDSQKDGPLWVSSPVESSILHPLTPRRMDHSVFSQLVFFSSRCLNPAVAGWLKQ